jgi:tetratricopeptide (TPR) repeat protein
MRHRAYYARWLVLLWLLAALAGCSGFGLRRSLDHGEATPEQAARNQQISEHAQEAIDRRDYEQARLELLRLTTQVPASAEAQQRLGMVLQLEGRLPEAEVCFRAALQRDPDYVEALIGLGQVEALRGDDAAALKHLETAIEIDPHRPRAHSCLGHLLESQGKTDEALAEYFRTTELEPNNAEVGLAIANIQLARRQPDQALSRLDQVVELAPENGEARDLRGRAHLTLRQFAQASEDFTAAAKRFPNRADIYYNLALALEADQKPAEALSAIEQTLRLAPDFADARRLSHRLALAKKPGEKVRIGSRVGATEAPADPTR